MFLLSKISLLKSYFFCLMLLLLIKSSISESTSGAPISNIWRSWFNVACVIRDEYDSFLSENSSYTWSRIGSWIVLTIRPFEAKQSICMSKYFRKSNLYLLFFSALVVTFFFLYIALSIIFSYTFSLFRISRNFYLIILVISFNSILYYCLSSTSHSLTFILNSFIPWFPFIACSKTLYYSVCYYCVFTVLTLFSKQMSLKGFCSLNFSKFPRRRNISQLFSWLTFLYGFLDFLLEKVKKKV